MSGGRKVDAVGRTAQEEGTSGTKAHTLKRKVRILPHMTASTYIMIKIDFPSKQVEKNPDFVKFELFVHFGWEPVQLTRDNSISVKLNCVSTCKKTL